MFTFNVKNHNLYCIQYGKFLSIFMTRVSSENHEIFFKKKLILLRVRKLSFNKEKLYFSTIIIPTILVIIFWSFTIFQNRSDSPQVKGNLISSIANLEIRKHQKRLKFGWTHSLVSSLPSRTQNLRIAVRDCRSKILVRMKMIYPGVL